ncbi:DUF4188 domain-containing protein [Marinilongibacter aquaticus]|uniref:DUF4188 domain-containing protein n=1 Tax=Marinilongibacter aquaticus TaxID=2975157 RepID=UPI0021BDBE1E|nr:DUF4188 domain-containing protein [Marinilongibacter aquaticus]UBM57576.1 DUF4188 domain-containing protein [Marinilongibacter aquaticus]
MKRIEKRMTAQPGKEFVVFLIGMRVNKWWQFGHILQTAKAMTSMMKELHQKPELGFLGGEGWGGRTTLMVQYWESFEKLESFARDPDKTHFPAWKAFYQRAKNSSGGVGIWHETYTVKPGQYESVYFNMPLFGLGKVFGPKEAVGNAETARLRLKES